MGAKERLARSVPTTGSATSGVTTASRPGQAQPNQAATMWSCDQSGPERPGCCSGAAGSVTCRTARPRQLPAMLLWLEVSVAMRRDTEDGLTRAGSGFVQRPVDERRTAGPVFPSGAMIEQGGLLSLQRLVGNRVLSNLMAGGGTMGAQRALGRARDSAESVPDERSPVYDAIGRGGGRGLDPRIRATVEAFLGQDFGSVRVHSDARSTESVDAAAYTVGEEIVIHPDHFAVGTLATDRLLAHELSHVAQQRSGPVAGTPAPGGIRISDPSDRFEREADANARELTPLIARVMSGDAPRTPPNAERHTHVSHTASLVNVQRGKKGKRRGDGEREKEKEKEKEHDTGPTVTTIGAHHPAEFEPPESANYLVDPRWREVFVVWILTVGDWHEVGLDEKLVDLYLQLDLASAFGEPDYKVLAEKILASEADAVALHSLLGITGTRLGQEGAPLSVEDVRVLLEKGGEGQKRAVLKFFDVLEARVRITWGVFRMWARSSEGQAVLSKKKLGSTQGGSVPEVKERRRR
jgi:Domain of unknown function (DUF4157)